MSSFNDGSREIAICPREKYSHLTIEFVEEKMRSAQLPEALRRSLLNNPSQRLPIFFLLDKSGSMAGPPINSLNSAIETFAVQMKGSPETAKNSIISVATIGGEVDLIQPPIPANLFCPIPLEANGDTPTAEVVLSILDYNRFVVDTLHQHSIDTLPSVFALLSDGYPTSEPSQLLRMSNAFRNAVRQKEIQPIIVATDDGDFDAMSQLFGTPVIPMANFSYSDVFRFLFKSVRSVSQGIIDVYGSDSAAATFAKYMRR